MTAGQIAAPYRQIRPSLLVAALVVTFAIGLLTGLAAQRVVGQGAQAAANPGGVAVATGSGTFADRFASIRAKYQLQAAAAVGAVNKPSAFVAAPAAGQVTVGSRITADGQDIQLGTRFGSAATLPRRYRRPIQLSLGQLSRRMDRTSGSGLGSAGRRSALADPVITTDPPGATSSRGSVLVRLRGGYPNAALPSLWGAAVYLRARLPPMVHQ